MAANDKQELHNRLVASGAQPLIGMATPSSSLSSNRRSRSRLSNKERNQSSQEIRNLLIDEPNDDNEDNNHHNDSHFYDDSDPDDDDADIQTSYYIVNKRESTYTSRRSILKNSGIATSDQETVNSPAATHDQQHNKANQATNEVASSHCNNKQFNRSFSKERPDLMRVPTSVKTKSETFRQQLKPRERAILTEKEFPIVEQASIKDNTIGANRYPIIAAAATTTTETETGGQQPIRRSQSRISWNLDEEKFDDDSSDNIVNRSDRNYQSNGESDIRPINDDDESPIVGHKSKELVTSNEPMAYQTADTAKHQHQGYQNTHNHHQKQNKHHRQNHQHHQNHVRPWSTNGNNIGAGKRHIVETGSEWAPTNGALSYSPYGAHHQDSDSSSGGRGNNNNNNDQYSKKHPDRIYKATAVTTDSEANYHKGISNHHRHPALDEPDTDATRSYKLKQFNDDELNPEPVYVCKCCGVVCELAPSMRSLHKFRLIFFIFNLLVLLFGIATFGMGLWFRIDPKVYELHKYIETQNFTIAGWIMLFAGFIVAITSFVGFRGAIKSRTSYLAFYFVMVAIVTLLLMGALVLVTVYGLGQSLERFATKEVFQQIQQKPFSDRSAQFLDFLQVKMKCCGATSFEDYARLGMNHPVSCEATDRNYVNAPGCGHAFRELFDIRAGMAAGFCAGAIFVQLVAITMAAIMFCIIYHSRLPSEKRQGSSNRG